MNKNKNTGFALHKKYMIFMVIEVTIVILFVIFDIWVRLQSLIMISKANHILFTPNNIQCTSDESATELVLYLCG